MTIVLRIVLIIACALTCCYTLHKIRKSQMQIEDSLFWIVISILLVVISIFPQIPTFCSNVLGIGATVNFVFLAMIFILVMKVFLLSVKLSQMEYRIKNLVQKLAIKDNEREKVLEDLLKNNNEKIGELKKEIELEK